MIRRPICLLALAAFFSAPVQAQSDDFQGFIAGVAAAGEVAVHMLREDLMPAVRGLHDTIAGLKRDGIEQIVLVAHSMGGLIACYYLRYGVQEPETAKETWEGADKITAVVVAGVPFEGSMTVFRNMTYGRPIGWNETLLSFETVSSFPASYYLLPHAGTDVLFSQGRLERQGLISDAANWDRYH